MIYLLTSVGLPLDYRNDFLKLLSKAVDQTKVAFIPTAADPETDKWFVAAARNELLEIGFQVDDLDLKRESEITLVDKLSQVDIIYVNGGNTFYLMDWVFKSGFDHTLRNPILQDKIYIGGSAGSIIAGPDIEISGWDPSWDTNSVGLTNFSGMNLVSFAISPHFTQTQKPILESKSKEVTYPIVAITDHQAVLVKGDTVKILGPGNYISYNNFQVHD